MIKYTRVLCLFYVLFSILGILTGCTERVPDILNHIPEDVAFVSKRVSLIHHKVDPGCGSGGLQGPCIVTEWDVLVLEAERTDTGWQVDVYKQPNLELHHITVTDGKTPIDIVKNFAEIGNGVYSFILESPLPYMELTVFPLSTVNLEIPENDPSCIEIIQDDALVLEVERTHTGWQVDVYKQRSLNPRFDIWVTDGGEIPINVVKDFIELGDEAYSFILESPLPYMELTVSNLPTVSLETLEVETYVNCAIKYIDGRHSVKPHLDPTEDDTL